MLRSEAVIVPLQLQLTAVLLIHSKTAASTPLYHLPICWMSDGYWTKLIEHTFCSNQSLSALTLLICIDFIPLAWRVAFFFFRPLIIIIFHVAFVQHHQSDFMHSLSVSSSSLISDCCLTVSSPCRVLSPFLNWSVHNAWCHSLDLLSASLA